MISFLMPFLAGAGVVLLGAWVHVERLGAEHRSALEALDVYRADARSQRMRVDVMSAQRAREHVEQLLDRVPISPMLAAGRRYVRPWPQVGSSTGVVPRGHGTLRERCATTRRRWNRERCFDPACDRCFG